MDSRFSGGLELYEEEEDEERAVALWRLLLCRDEEKMILGECESVSPVCGDQDACLLRGAVAGRGLYVTSESLSSLSPCADGACCLLPCLPSLSEMMDRSDVAPEPVSRGLRAELKREAGLSDSGAAGSSLAADGVLAEG